MIDERTDEADDQGEWSGLTRRQVLAGGGAAALAAALGIETGTAQQIVDVTGGSTTAVARATNVADGLWIGPRTVADAIDSAPDRLFVGTDFQPPLLHEPESGPLSHSVIASGNGLPAFVAPGESELATPPSTPAMAVADDVGLRVATGESFATADFRDTNMTRARSIHVAESIADLPTPSETPAIAVTVQDGTVVFS